MSYETGNGVPRDPVKAKAYYEVAAKLGSMVAQYNLGTFLYKSAAGDDATLREAFRYFTQAAELGHINAMRALAEFYRGGRIMPRDDATALLWIRKAEAAGCVKAKTELALAYQRGRGVAADIPVAVALYRQAAEGGDVVAQHNLGLRYDCRMSSRPCSRSRNPAPSTIHAAMSSRLSASARRRSPIIARR